jgi:hypothetical protein
MAWASFTRVREGTHTGKRSPRRTMPETAVDRSLCLRRSPRVAGLRHLAWSTRDHTDLNEAHVFNADGVAALRLAEEVGSVGADRRLDHFLDQ